MDHIEFYQQHKNAATELRPLPDYGLEDQARWIISGHGYQYLELDWMFPTAQWQKESNLAEPYYVAHRDEATGEGTHNGWSSCVLHGIGIDKTNVYQTYGYETEPTYSWTELGEKCKSIRMFFETVFPAERFARIRFMRLAPGGWISPHNDFSPMVTSENLFDFPIPVNIAVDHPDNCHMTIKDSGVVPFESGKMCLVNIFRDHSVVNFSDRPRIHIIAHCYLGNRKKEYCELIVDSYRKQHERISKQIH